MFKDKTDNNLSDISLNNEQSSAATCLGADALWKGELIFKGTLCIDGKFEGQIKTGDMLIVSETGDIKADIEAGIVVCKGRVKGNILASQKVEMYPKSIVTGDVKTPALNIEIGAVLDGKCDMSSKEIGDKLSLNSNENLSPERET